MTSKTRTHDIQSTHELTINPKLGESGPVGVLLETLPHLVVRQDVEEAKLDKVFAQNGHELPREAALRRIGGALHEEHDGRRLDEVRQPLEQLLLGLLRVDRLVGLGGNAIGGDALVAVDCGRGAGGGTRVLRVRLDGRAHLDGAAAADRLNDLTVTDEDEEGHGGDVVGFAEVAELLCVYGDPGGLWWARDGVVCGEGRQDGGHLGAGRGPGRVEGNDEEGGRCEGGEVLLPVGHARDLGDGRHYGVRVRVRSTRGPGGRLRWTSSLSAPR